MSSGPRNAFTDVFRKTSLLRHAFVASVLTMAAVFMAGPTLIASGAVFKALLQSPEKTLATIFLLSNPLRKVLSDSVLLAAATALSALLLGLLLTAATWRARAHWPGKLRWVLLALLAVPSYVHALAWNAFMHRCNLMLAQWGLPGLPEQGWTVAWLVQTMTLVPLATGGCMLGLELVDARLVSAARPLRSDLAVFATVVLPTAAPILLATGTLLFLLSVEDYGVPSLFQVPVYAMHIFAVYSTRADAGQAFLAAMPLLGVTAVALLAGWRALRRLHSIPAPRENVWSTRPVWPFWFNALLCFAIGAGVLQLLVPAFELTAATGSWSAFSSSVLLAEREIMFSFRTSLLAALFSLPLAWSVAGMMRGKHLFGGLAGILSWTLLLLCLATPAPLAGVGLIAIWNSAWLHPIYDSSLMPVLASMTRYAPLATLIFLAHDEQAATKLLQAARVFQRDGWQTLWRIRLPLALPLMLAAGGLVFALSLGELGATLLVAPPGKATLTMRIYNYLHYGSSETVSGLSLLIATISGFMGFCTLTALRRIQFYGQARRRQ
ncbi:ABC transporter permease [Desulfovibrio inopinatus]|uniref:ABC transporter permease n=1 Tax=Desulfovibrio inopinatus TaxID=102109 RepID=UPI0003F4DF07|nr:ABC transporter permease subunit [Desulfovibrio inopinatus]